MTSLQALFIQAIDVFFNVIEWLIFIRILLSWIPMLEKSPLGGGMMLDFSPIIALILMVLVKQLLMGLVLLF